MGEERQFSLWDSCHKSASLETAELVSNRDENLKIPPTLNAQRHRAVPSPEPMQSWLQHRQ